MAKDTEATFEMLKHRLREFNTKRDWNKYHNPKDLAVSISIESAELLENFQWQSARDAKEVAADKEKMAGISDELADILIYSFILADRLDIDISTAMLSKIEKNEERFDIDKKF